MTEPKPSDHFTTAELQAMQPLERHLLANFVDTGAPATIRFRGDLSPTGPVGPGVVTLVAIADDIAPALSAEEKAKEVEFIADRILAELGVDGETARDSEAKKAVLAVIDAHVDRPVWPRRNRILFQIAVPAQMHNPQQPKAPGIPGTMPTIFDAADILWLSPGFIAQEKPSIIAPAGQRSPGGIHIS